MLFKGTSLTRGSGVGVVIATGLATELGQVSQLVEEAEPGCSPLEKKLARLSGATGLGHAHPDRADRRHRLLTGKDAFLMIEAAIALAVAAIPEGLPIVATLALARGMWRMARQNALIERLSAVETLGATTVILTDKTGTLTENRMTVRRLWVPSGEIELDGQSGDAKPPLARRRRAALAAAGDRACSATTPRSTAAHEQGSGDPMELALLRAGFRAGLERARRCWQHSPIVHRHAFDTASKMMATVHRRGDEYLFAVKGAPEAVLAAADKCRRRTTAKLRHRCRRCATEWHAPSRASRPSRAARAGLRHEDGQPGRRAALRRLDFPRPDRPGGSGARRRAARHSETAGTPASASSW